MDRFLDTWHEAAVTTVGLFWTAFWAFGLGYLISSMIQVFVTRARMRRTMGDAGPKSIALGSLFGFISSSCSFAALSTTRALFAKGAGLVPSLAFLLASTNLVIELGIVIAMFLGWQFVVGEYVGGMLLILLMWPLVRLTRPDDVTEEARERAQSDTDEDEDDPPDWKERIRTKDGWRQVAIRYAKEWTMVWKDVTVGFTVAGVIAAFVPSSFFEILFVGAGSDDPATWQIVVQAFVGPVAAFFTFIGSMGNIPLAAVLFDNGVSFAGLLAFIFSDLVVLPVLRVQAKYYGWKMALYIMGVFFVVLVTTAILLHYGFAAIGQLPDSSAARSVTERDFFNVDYTMVLDIVFGVVSLVGFGWTIANREASLQPVGESVTEKTLFVLALLALAWLAGGLLVPLLP